MTLAEHMPPQHVPASTDSDPWPVRLMPGPRWFTEDDPIYRLHADPSTPVGELAAVLLEALQPGCAGFLREIGCANVWTAARAVHEYDQVVVHGTIDDAMVTISRRHEMRLAVHGRDESGAYFWGGDRELTKWTLQARVWAMLAANREFSPEPLDDVAADAAVADWARIARLAGVVDPAESFGELNSYLRQSSPGLRRTAVAQTYLEQLGVGRGPASSEEEGEAEAARAAAAHGMRASRLSDSALGHAALTVLPPRLRRLLGLAGDVMGRLAAPVAAFARVSRASAPLGDVPAPIAPPSALRLARLYR